MTHFGLKLCAKKAIPNKTKSSALWGKPTNMCTVDNEL